MLVNQLRMRITPQQNGEIIEPGHNTLQFDTVHQEDRDRHLAFADAVQENVLDALRFFASHFSIPCFWGPSGPVHRLPGAIERAGSSAGGRSINE
jgi:hypothetical protein